jgi:conjugal transfer ATP-binding protein TraC
MDGGSLWEKLRRRKKPADARQSNATHSDGRPLAKRGKAPVIDRFADLLPYVGYDEKTQLFALEGLRAGEYEGLGYALEVTPQIGANKALADAMLNLLSGDCPAGTAIQVTLFATPRIEAYLQRMVECSVDPASARGQVFPERFALMRRMVEQRAEFYRRGTMAAILPNNNLRLRQFRGFFSVVYPAKRPFDRSSISEALRLRQTHIGTLQQYGLYGGTWSISDLLWYLQCVLNPQRVMHGDTPIIAYDPAVEPRRRAASPDTRIEFTEESVEFSSGGDADAAISARCMSVRSYPSAPFYLNQMSELLGSLTNGTIAYPCPYTLTLGVSLPEYEATKNKTILAAANAQRTADLPIARFTPEAAAINEDWKLAQEAFLHESVRLMACEVE